MHEAFGNGSPWASFAVDPPLTVEALRKIASWFLVVHTKDAPPPDALEDPTGSLGLPRTNTGGTGGGTSAPGALGGLPRTSTSTSVGGALPPSRTKTGGGTGDPGPGLARYIFRIKRGPMSQFDFISLGRNPGNDISVPDESVSRFHAFFRETPWGLSLVDAKSANGTWAAGARVAAQGAGEPAAVGSGDAVRFGDIRGVVLDAEGLLHLLAQAPA